MKSNIVHLGAKLLLLATVVCITCCSNANAQDPEKMIFKIDLQDEFDRDIVEFRINSCLIFFDVLHSYDLYADGDRYYNGFAEYEIIAYEHSGLVYIVVKYYPKVDKINHNNKKRSVKTMFCSSLIDLNDSIRIDISVGAEITTKEIDLKNGKYIGISKISRVDDRVIIRQENFQYAYD